LIGFNIILFMGFGLDIALGKRRPYGRQYFVSCALNSISLIIVSCALCFLCNQYPGFFSYHRIFLVSVVFGYFLNEILFKLFFQGERDIFDSLNFVNCGFPFFLISTFPQSAEVSLPAASVAAQAFGAAVGFFSVSMLFYFLRGRISEEARSAGEFNLFCYELVTLGLMSASFSIFFKVI